MNSIFIGFDPREAAAFAACRHSILSRLTQPIPVRGIVLSTLRDAGLYWRETQMRKNATGAVQLFDVISEHPMSTEFAISRFLTPHLAAGTHGREGAPLPAHGWAAFCDCDVLATVNMVKLFQQLDPAKAVMCVQHDHRPAEQVKMDGQIQSRYSRKNWSSVMAFNLAHPSNQALTVDLVNRLPGRDLHAFCWLSDDEIGALHPRWNYLVGHSKLEDEKPALIHFTDGYPMMPGYETVEFAEDFWRELHAWAK